MIDHLAGHSAVDADVLAGNEAGLLGEIAHKPIALLAIDHMHTRTGPTEFTGNALADALRTTGDDDDLVLEIHQSTLVKISGELSILGNIRLMIISYTLRHRHTTHPNLHPASAGSLRELPRPRTGKDGMPPRRDIFPPPLGGPYFSQTLRKTFFRWRKNRKNQHTAM